jgi:hypothetical protein
VARYQDGSPWILSRYHHWGQHQLSIVQLWEEDCSLCTKLQSVLSLAQTDLCDTVAWHMHLWNAKKMIGIIHFGITWIYFCIFEFILCITLSPITHWVPFMRVFGCHNCTG